MTDGVGNTAPVEEAAAGLYPMPELPKPDVVACSEPPKASEEVPYADKRGEESEDQALTILFRDGLDQPIQGMTLTLTLPTGASLEAKTLTKGDVSFGVPQDRKGQVKIEVKDDKGEVQPVCEIDLSKCKQVAIARSPKVKVDMPLRAHQQAARPTPPKTAAADSGKRSSASSKPDRALPPAAAAASPVAGAAPKKQSKDSTWWNVNGAVERARAWLAAHVNVDGLFSQSHAAVTKTLSEAGQPVTIAAGPECPNSDNLRLGRNNVYRTQILSAAKRLGLAPQALCALMDCEAGKVAEKLPRIGPDGNQMKDKKGRLMTVTVRELWNANAGNPQSGAAGLTQFLASTWLTHVLMPGCFIHEQSVAKGWVRREKNAKGKSYWAFVLSDGSITTTPGKQKGDQNVKNCLAMRMDPDWSINAAADYGNANLKVLEKQGFKLAGLSDMDRAKLMYLMHHEGEGAGPLFIKNRLVKGSGGEAGLRRKFEIQLGAEGAAKANEMIEEADGDVEKAYRAWFAVFVDRQFAQSEKYFCSVAIKPSRLSDLLVKIGGEEISIVE
ncbi:hypothetical protein [uncultured Aquabacterium sp.]|jgi:hypothetical protein|uniref:hypothetical protein n=1 Tax=uncultured Aquabacterium sp. TaxID=158753 RepID=UPI002611FD51|nr:hypothetical protein [uncultured Aquabacterium sp.]